MYNRNDLGQFEKHLDFRRYPEDFDYESRPRVPFGELYVDEDFPFEVAMGRPRGFGRRQLDWKRPPEFASDPCLFSKGHSRYDIGQGSIGTCWFLASVANVADKPQLLRRIIPDDSYPVGTPRYDGVFHCRFWRFGRWDDVFIDDYLPVIFGDQIYSAHSETDPNEMWVSLLEKAFARMYGSYPEVSGGTAADSYMALTGGIPEDIDLKKMSMDPDQLHTRVRNALSSGAAITCSVPSEFNNKYGLIGPHEYTINGAVMANGVRLFRLRNPWGEKEWTGPYSDGSPEWKKYTKKNHWTTFFISFSDNKQYCTSLYGKWEGKEAAGFREKTKNPKFQFTVDESSADINGNIPFVVQIIQRTKQRKTRKLGIRADLYRVLGGGSNDLLVLEEEGIPSKNNFYLGSVQTSFRFTLKPGKYVCIPSTGDKGKEKEFLLRLYSAGPLRNIIKVDTDTTVLTCDKDGAEQYSHLKCITGQWRAGSNAGGQIRYDSFHTNPQLKIAIPRTQKVKLQLLSDPNYPIGIKMFKVGFTVSTTDTHYFLQSTLPVCVIIFIRNCITFI
ncbi:calpain-A-like [Saccostrea cucullata]|uniref:calpain-A-like n=1 Tax=Saccostrea cuccullata TaxID=36930 RepID=UPI002ED480F6